MKNISPDQKNNPIDIQKTARIFEDGIRQRNGSIEHNVAEIDKIVRADKNFDEFLSNFESTYEKEMETYSRKISKESIKQFSSELKHYIREKSYSDLDHNTTTDGFSIHQASKTLFDQLFPASRNSSIPSKLEMIQEVEVDPLNATTSNFTPSKVVINRGEHHNRARSVGRNYRE